MSDQTQAKTATMFRWYELRTTDAAAAESFYSAVVGWRPESVGAQSGGYTTFNTARGGVAGMMTLGAGEGPARWTGYIAVDDVDAMAERIKAAGGEVRQPPTDVPGILRFADVADPQGAPFVVFKGSNPEGPPMGGPNDLGYIGWRELLANDGAKAFAFYAGLFGWTATGVHDMGPMGAYQLWTDGRGGDAGGVMSRPPGAPGPSWNFYFQVDSIGAAISRVQAAGGVVTNGPHQVPGGAWTVHAADSQGAAFSLMSAEK